MILFLDVETTGLDPVTDEILSLTMIQYDYESNSFRTCFDLKFKPLAHSEWPEAEKINNISPADVADCFSFNSYVNDIQYFIDQCDKIVIYNVPFDSAFLESYGIDLSGFTFIDPMISYASRYNNGKWKSLFYVYNNLVGHPFKDSHTSLGDTRALVEISTILYPELFRVDIDHALEILYA